ncbi:MAG TPA: hypothetical protein VE781_17765, partial [Kineosporiaceae bacterium]|nr:hypothetical protein [Kineosporiaceae bacterium]
MLLPAAAAPEPRGRGHGRPYDPVEAKAVVATLFLAATVIGVAVELLPVWPGTSRLAIGVIALCTAVGALTVPRLRQLPYFRAAAMTAGG